VPQPPTPRTNHPPGAARIRHRTAGRRTRSPVLVALYDLVLSSPAPWRPGRRDRKPGRWHSWPTPKTTPPANWPDQQARYVLANIVATDGSATPLLMVELVVPPAAHRTCPRCPAQACPPCRTARNAPRPMARTPHADALASRSAKQAHHCQSSRQQRNNNHATRTDQADLRPPRAETAGLETSEYSAGSGAAQNDLLDCLPAVTTTGRMPRSIGRGGGSVGAELEAHAGRLVA
jgi:hypothetical protein